MIFSEIRKANDAAQSVDIRYDIRVTKSKIQYIFLDSVGERDDGDFAGEYERFPTRWI